MNQLMNYRGACALLTMACLFLSTACNNGEGHDAPDVDHIKLQVGIQRFDQDLFSLDTNAITAGVVSLGQKYPELLPLFAGNIIRDQTNPNETQEQAISAFLKSAQIRKLYDTVQHSYADLRWLEKDLNQMFRYYKYYFPQKPTPKVVTMVSEFAVDAFTYGDSLCGIGLDMFLGESYWGYNPDIFPSYVRRQFTKEYITIRLAKALAQNAFGETPPGSRLLDMMLYNGKMLYIVDKLQPKVPDSLIMGYTLEQMEGCYANEKAVWARLLSQKLLYSSDFNEFRKLVTPSPNAPVVFQEAPGEVGNWMGWQIVKSYMKRHPETTIDALIQFQDSQKFLEEARYKPKM